MRTTKKALSERITKIENSGLVYSLKSSVSELKKQIESLEYVNTNLNKKIDSLSDSFGELNFRVNNPPKYKVGDIFKGNIVTSVVVDSHIEPNHLLTIGFPIDKGDAFLKKYYYWVYFATNIKTGSTSTL
jgi:predicted nuclease with TOPRIM domain